MNRLIRISIVVTTLFVNTAVAADDDELDARYRDGGACTRASIAALRSCKLQHQVDVWLTRGKCNSRSNQEERDKCRGDCAGHDNGSRGRLHRAI